MIKDISSIKIGPVWNGGRGATFKDEMEVQPDFGTDIKLVSPVQGEIMLVRMKNGITVVLNDIFTEVEQICVRCLETFTQPVRIAAAEAHFYEEAPNRETDPTEFFFIQTQGMSIDLTDALRQEIILQFPMIPVCSERCQGLCTSCAVNLNHFPHLHDCSLKKDVQEMDLDTDTHRPFAHLKDLLNK